MLSNQPPPVTTNDSKFTTVDSPQKSIEPSKTGKSANATTMRTSCPRCQGTRINRDGSPKGNQRYKCLSCGRRWFVTGLGEAKEGENPNIIETNPKRLATGNPTTGNSTTGNSTTGNSTTGNSTTGNDTKPSIPTGDGQKQPVLEREAKPGLGTLHDRMTVQLDQLSKAKSFASSLGDDVLHAFANMLEANVRPITAVVHNAVARARLPSAQRSAIGPEPISARCGDCNRWSGIGRREKSASGARTLKP
jgi:hypothetical protein